MTRIEVKLYSILKRLAGKDTLFIDVEDNRVSSLLQALTDVIPGLEKLLTETGLELIVIDEEGHRLEYNDFIHTGIVHVMPPPAGGSNIMVRLASPNDDQDNMIHEVLSFLTRDLEDDTGATLLFIGTVRGLNKGEKVEYLDYEDAGEITTKFFEKIARDIARKKGVRRVAGIHYTGKRLPGDVTLILGVSGISRKDVFPALIEFIERVKSEVPIWKREKTLSGEKYILGGDNIVIK